VKLLDVMTAPWAITPDKFAEIQEVYLRHVRGQSLTDEELGNLRAAGIIKLKPADGKREPYQNLDGVALIAIEGTIAKKANLFSDISGGASTQLIGQAIGQALEDRSVHVILLHIDSPGGTVDGTQELARQVFAARRQKPIAVYTDGMMCSAAYWIGAAAEELYISGDTVVIGSIGVVASHTDWSKFEEMRGIKTTEIVAGKFKRIASSHAPLTDIGRATIQEQVDHIYSVFVQDVATFRGVTPETVLKDMADGRIFLGLQAVERGLVDGVRSFDALVSELATRQPTGGARMSGTAGQKVITQAELDKAVSEARDAGKQEGLEAGRAEGEKQFEAGKAEGLKLGAEQERERIKGVQAQFLPGHQALIQELMFDGKTTGPEAAVKVLEAERKGKQGKLEEFFADAPAPVVPTAPVETAEAKTDDAKREKLIKDIQERDKCDYQKAALTAAKEQPALFRHR
jgi:signal peptide peptidase SppA